MASIYSKPHLDKHFARVQKLESQAEVAKRSHWLNPNLVQQTSSAKVLRGSDPQLHSLIYQKKKQNFSIFSLNPWIVPQFSLLIFVVLVFGFFAGFVENRIGSVLFGVLFLSLYYGGFLSASMFADGEGILFGGTSIIFILSGAYLALFPLKEICLWIGDDIRPMASLPVWTSVSIFLVAIESLGWGGHLQMADQSTMGYTHFPLLLSSYFIFALAGRLRPLPQAYLSLKEAKLIRLLERALGLNALYLMKQLLKYNPSHLDPVDIYYRRVIEPLNSKEALSPENKKFLEKYLCLLVAHHYDKENFDRIVCMLKARPFEVLPANFFKLLYPKEWLELARQLDRRGEWMETLFVYATCLDYFGDIKLRSEALKRAEVLIHRKFKECIDDHLKRPVVLRHAKQFISEHPKSKISRILLDHVQHLRNVVVRAQSEDSGEVA